MSVTWGGWLYSRLNPTPQGQERVHLGWEPMSVTWGGWLYSRLDPTPKGQGLLHWPGHPDCHRLNCSLIVFFHFYYYMDLPCPTIKLCYKEAHAGNYAIVRTKGDTIVNHALDSILEREMAWTRKNSTIVEMDKMWKTHQS